jgi:hypothetical protein
MDALIAEVNSTQGEDRLAAQAAVEAQFAEDQPFVTLAPWVRGSVSRLPDGVFTLVQSSARMESQSK